MRSWKFHQTSAMPFENRLTGDAFTRHSPDRDVLRTRQRSAHFDARGRNDRNDLPPREQVRGAKIRMRVTFIPTSKRNDERDRIAIARLRSNVREKRAIFGIVAARIRRRVECGRESAPIRERHAQQNRIRCDDGGDDESDDRQAAAHHSARLTHGILRAAWLAKSESSAPRDTSITAKHRSSAHSLASTPIAFPKRNAAASRSTSDSRAGSPMTTKSDSSTFPATSDS